MAGVMAGSLGGERSATFHFLDITGIEYNSGLLSGVLEVLTASYAGGTTKDFWASGENDPWKQSNCLPLTKAEFNVVQRDIAEVRTRIAEAKRPTVVVQAPTPAPVAPPASGLAAQLEQLAALHASGVLNDDEFATAKQRVLAAG